MRYPVECIFVDRKGNEFPAKICGYLKDGTLAERMRGDALDVVKAEKTDLPSMEIEVEDHEGKKYKTKIKEYRTRGVSVRGEPLPTVSLLINIGSDKRGEVWTDIQAVRHFSHVSTGKMVGVTCYWKNLEKKS